MLVDELLLVRHDIALELVGGHAAQHEVAHKHLFAVWAHDHLDAAALEGQCHLRALDHHCLAVEHVEVHDNVLEGLGRLGQAELAPELVGAQKYIFHAVWQVVDVHFARQGVIRELKFLDVLRQVAQVDAPRQPVVVEFEHAHVHRELVERDGPAKIVVVRAQRRHALGERLEIDTPVKFVAGDAKSDEEARELGEIHSAAHFLIHEHEVAQGVWQAARRQLALKELKIVGLEDHDVPRHVGEVERARHWPDCAGVPLQAANLLRLAAGEPAPRAWPDLARRRAYAEERAALVFPLGFRLRGEASDEELHEHLLGHDEFEVVS